MRTGTRFARKRYNPVPDGSVCNEDRLSTEDSQGENRFRRSPTGPAVAPPRIPPGQAPAPPVQAPRRRRHFWSVALFVLLASGVLIRAYRDLSRPEAWDYWKDQYVSPGLTSQVIDTLHLEGSNQGAGKGRRALFVSGTISARRDWLDPSRWSVSITCDVRLGETYWSFQ